MLGGHHDTMQAVFNMSEEITEAQAQVKFPEPRGRQTYTLPAIDLQWAL